MAVCYGVEPEYLVIAAAKLKRCTSAEAVRHSFSPEFAVVDNGRWPVAGRHYSVLALSVGGLSCVINHSHVQIIALSIGSLFLVSAGPVHTQDIYDGVLLESGAATPNISTAELQSVLMDHSATIVDVRTFAEYALGHIPGAVNVVGKSGSTRGVLRLILWPWDIRKFAAINWVFLCGGHWAA